MNGSLEESRVVDRRPIITCFGELEVFSAIEDELSATLPQDSCEWRRTMGRPIRSVHVGANFAPFNPTALPRGGQWDLIRQPLFHVYWTECVDVDLYKTTVRDDISQWIKEMTSRDIHDWLIVVVENYDGKRTNKLLPRTTVLDKIRTDFAAKQGDRCISVINPGKPESRSADSWRGLLARIRHLLLVAYAKAVSRLEDYVRLQREKRNEAGWSFINYFNLQEELAQVLEMLHLYDEALVQYDELDVLFSQYVSTSGGPTSLRKVKSSHSMRNSSSTQSAASDGSLDNRDQTIADDWLEYFQRPLQRWHGPRLGGKATLPRQPSLLELRAYLFSKQSQMLQYSDKIWDIASRCLPLLHTCIRELQQLEVSAPEGAVACWQFLGAMEVLHACDQYNGPENAEAYSMHTACLWAYASEKLRDLGDICGLMPGNSPTSEQLHAVVYLSAGMGDNPGTRAAPSPTDKLKEALCTQEAFNKHYLELSELAMCTYKHTGRLRSARLVGRRVAQFYRGRGELQKAAAFLTDALRTVETDGWRELAAHAHLELAQCHRLASDWRKYIRSCIAVANAPEMDNLLRWTHFDEMRRCLDEGLLDRPLIVLFGDVIRITEINIKSSLPVVQDTSLEVELVLESNFPRDLVCSEIQLSLNSTNASSATKTNDPSLHTDQPTATTDKPTPGATTTAQPSPPSLAALLRHAPLQRLRVRRHLDYKQDKQLASASVIASLTPTSLAAAAAAVGGDPGGMDGVRGVHSALRRGDSAYAPTVRSEFGGEALVPEKLPVLLLPGTNHIRLSRLCTETGSYQLGEIAIHSTSNLRLLSGAIPTAVLHHYTETSVDRSGDGPRHQHSKQKVSNTIEVRRVEPKVRLDKFGPEVLLSGIEQMLELRVEIGSYALPEDTCIRLTCSQGVTVQLTGNIDAETSISTSPAPLAPLVSHLDVRLKSEFCATPFSSLQMPVRIHAEMPSREHEVRISCSWLQKPERVVLGFAPPLSTTWRLHTAKHRKFIQIAILGQCEKGLIVSNPVLFTGSHIKVDSFNSTSSHTIHNGLSISYVFELLLNSSNEDVTNVKGDFSLLYALKTNTEDNTETSEMFRTYHHYFDISDFQTLYHVEATVLPAKGTEFCRVGAVCHLHLTLTPTQHHNASSTTSAQSSIMYEVIAEQYVWAVVGRTAGVVSFERSSQTTTRSIVTSARGGDGTQELTSLLLSSSIDGGYSEEKQVVVIDVMPLTSGYLPLPMVRLSRYIPADQQTDRPGSNKGDIPRLEPFGQGQVYNTSKGQQVHVIATNDMAPPVF